MKRYNGNVTKAIIAYNRGNAKDLIRTEYSDKVISQWRNQNMKSMEVAIGF
jgi:soluble lytic murein transglycosylase-like protein